MANHTIEINGFDNFIHRHEIASSGCEKGTKNLVVCVRVNINLVWYEVIKNRVLFATENNIQAAIVKYNAALL